MKPSCELARATLGRRACGLGRYILSAAVLLLLSVAAVPAQVPQLLNYQGRVQVGTTDFNGTGQFKFALVNAGGTTTYWSNDGTPAGQPASSVTLPVTKGLYSVLLGNTALPNMTAVPPAAFANGDVHLRVWFNDGVNGFQQFVPDQRIAAVGYAIMAGTAQTAAGVASGAITSAMLADGAVTSNKLAIAAVTAPAIAAGAVTSNAIAAAAVGPSQLARKYAAGRFDSSQLGGLMFGEPVDLAENFGFHFGVPPILNYGFETPIPGGEIPADLSFVNKTTSGFTLRASGPKSQSVLVRSGNLRPPERSLAGFTFAQPSMAMINGRPTISCLAVETNRLVYFRALDANGNSWTPGVMVAPTHAGGSSSALAVVNGFPAIAYRDVLTKALKYVRALDPEGNAWANPTVVVALDVGTRISLTVADGNPAIAYTTEGGERLRYTRAANANGTSWDPSLELFGGRVGYAELIDAGGAPAIAFHDKLNRTLGYLRARDAKGGAWPSPQAIAIGEVDGYGFGEFASLALIKNHPAIAFYADASTHTNSLAVSQVRYLRANDPQGNTWGNPSVAGLGATLECWRQTGWRTYTVANFQRRTPVYEDFVIRTGIDAGRGVSLSAVGGGLPGILFRGCRPIQIGGPPPPSFVQQVGGTALDPGTCGIYDAEYPWQFVQASDVAGLTWSLQRDVATPEVSATDGRLISTGLKPAICYSSRDGLSYRTGPVGAGGWSEPFKDFETPLRRPLEPSGLVAQVTLTNGLPYLVYYDSSRSVLRHVPALELTGSSWQAPNTYNEVVDGGNNVGLGTAVIVHRGGVGVAYHDSTAGDLKYVHYDGATWSLPVRVDTAGNAGFKPSLALINGLPAIAYYADIAGGSLRYVRANTIEGNSWGTPLTVANGGAQPGAILRELNGKPAIAFRRFVSGSSSMRFVGALDASGNTWSAEVTVANNIDSLESGFAVVNGRPAMSFQQNFRLHYSRALDAEGSTWATPVLLDATSEFSGELSSLAVIGGRPAVAYMGAPTTLFTRAVDADGTSWGSPVVVDPSNFALLSLQLIEVDGKPGIGFRRDPVTQPQFQRATSAEGTQWDVPVPIEAVGTSGAYLSLNSDGNQIAASYYEPSEGALRVSRSLNQGLNWLEPSVPDGGGVGQFVSAAVVNGLPAVAYYDGNSGDLKFKRSMLVGGQIRWSSSATKILDTLGDTGLYPSLAVLNNQLPAVAYYDFSAGDLKFVRATDVNGAFWETPVVLASTGDVGRHASLVNLQGKPAIAYYDADNGALKFILANDEQGLIWGAPITVDSGANVRDVGMFASLAVVNGRPAIVYRDATSDRLLYVRANDALGATWPTPFPLGEHGGNHGVLRVINDRPVVAYVTKFLTMIVAATDVNGGNWARQFVAVPNSDVYSVALTDLNNNPSLTLLESRGVRNLYPIRRFQVNWFAVEP